MRYKAMNMLQGLSTKQHEEMRSLYIDGLSYLGDTKLVAIRVDHSWLLRFMARAMILALVIVSLPRMNTSQSASNAFKVNENLPIVFRDLANDGLLRMADKSLLLTKNGYYEDAFYNSQFVKDYNPDLISYSDLTRQNGVVDESFDFVFAFGYTDQSSNFIERALKSGGIVVVPLSDNPMPHPLNYKVVYVRKFESSTIVAMRKTAHASTKRRLLESSNEEVFGREATKKSNAKEAALKKLEDVLLEPPRAKSNRYLKKTRYLPDLMGVSLKSYPRRVFIDVGIQDKNEGSGDSTWFSKHYPTRNTKFDIFKIETVTEESSGKEIPSIGMSDWLKNNVKEEEYVVMKAEADVIEEMVKNKTIRLIDELFMECKHKGMKKGDKKSRRPYWECLSLYGLLRDEGIAVHQWWG